MKPLKTKRYGTGKHFKRIYLVAPKHPENFWSMQGMVDILGAKTLMPNSALATLMVLTPDEVDVEHFRLKEEPKVRSLFFRAMIKTWKIDPKFMRRYFTLITQFSHFYHFVNKKRH